MPQRRGRLFIDRKFQIALSLYVCAWLLAMAVIYPAITHQLFGYFINHKDALAEELEATRTRVVLLIVLLQVLFIAGAALMTVFISHRVVGPLIKLRNLLYDVERGDLDQTMQLRSNDHFQELAQGFNSMVEALRERREKDAERANAAIPVLERAMQSAQGEDRNDMARALTSLRDIAR